MTRYPFSLGAVCAVACSSLALATIPYTPVPIVGSQNVGPGVEPPSVVIGKEYSHDRDVDSTPAVDPQQIIAWDGIGGVADGQDFTGTRPNWTPDQDIDAIANHGDAWYDAVSRLDLAHLIFSIDRESAVVVPPAAGGAGAFGPWTLPSGGPVPLSNGNLIGGAGEISVENAGAFAPPQTQTVWATQVEINGMPLPNDIDGVEVWGPEPGFTADVDKYSLEVDTFSGVSVWNGTGGVYLTHGGVVSAVAALLGPVPGSAVLANPPGADLRGTEAIDLDALMVLDQLESNESFDRNPTGGGAFDSVLFSIRQVIDVTDPTGYYATGSEIFLLDSTGAVSFLGHGGHVWDKAYALTNLRVLPPVGSPNGIVVVDVDALEAIVQVPEPAAGLLVAFAAGVALRRRRD
ncbi:MAG: hypothetical protein ACRCT8_13980 [Lacipirellulaceae bacterium]